MGIGDWVEDRFEDVTGGIKSFGQSTIKRVDGFWDATWELGKAPVNLVWEFAESTKDLVTDEDVGVADWLYQVGWENPVEQAKNTGAALIGPEGIGGNIVEMMPGFVRSGGRDLLEGLEWTYNKGSRYASALMTAASLMEADGRGNDLSAWLDIDDYWDQAYEIAETRSIGQAIVLAFHSSEEKSILDEEAVAEWMDTTWFNVTSGTIDAAMRIFASPENLVFGAGMIAKASIRVRQFNNYFEAGGQFVSFSDDVARMADDAVRNQPYRPVDPKIETAGLDEVARIDDSVDLLTGRIREKYFPKHAEGDLISREIAVAHMGQEGFAGGTESVKNVMQFFMGDVTAIRRIALENPARGFDYGKLLKDWTHPLLATTPGRVGGSADEFLAAQRTHNEVMDAIEDGILAKDPDLFAEITGGVNVVPGWASIDVVIKPTRRINLQDKVRHSDWYRPEGGGANRFVRTIQLFRDMKPQHHIFAGDANSADNVARVMKESDLFSADEIARFRGDWASRGLSSRVALADKVQRDVVKGIIRRHIPKDEWLKANPGRSVKDYDSFVQLFAVDYAVSNKAARTAFNKARAFDVQDLNKGSEFTFVDDGAEVLMQSPLTPSQLQSSFFTIDARRLNRHVARAVRRTRKKVDDVIESDVIPEVSGLQTMANWGGMFVRGITDAWRPAVLLRPAWALRVVGDEQLRLFAKLQTLSGEGSGLWGLLTSNRRAYVESVFQRYALKNADEGADFLKNAERELKKLTRRRGVRAGAAGFVLGGGPGALLFGGGSFLRNSMAYRAMLKRSTRDGGFVRPHEEPLNIGGVEVEGPFGTHESPNLVMRESVSSQRQVGHALSHNARNTERNLRMGDWKRESTPYSRGQEKIQFREDWERVVNDQWNGSRSREIAKILFDDVTYVDDAAKIDALLNWYSTPAGKSFLKSRGHDLDDPDLVVALEELIEKQIAATNRMVVPTHDVGQVIRQRLVKGERVSADDLKNYTKTDDAPAQLHEFVGSVHAQEIDSLGPLGPGGAMVREFVDNAYQRVAGLTTDNLSRNPYFATVYRRSMERRIKAATNKQTGARLEISEDALRTMENAARKEALQEVRWLMYDLAESSRFSDMVRMIMPFYNAWQEVLTRWAGLAFENPVFASRMKDALTSNPDVDLGTLGAYETVQDADGNSFFQVRLPDFARGLLKEGWIGSGADDAGIIRFRTSSLNMITQGLPGFGPIAQFPASALIQKAPEFEEMMQFMLPYGPVELTDALPAWAKRTISAIGQNDRSYQNMAAQIMMTKLADMANGETDIIDFDDNSTRAQFLGEIRSAARGAMYVRAIGSAISPASFNLHSPYQEYIDIYRKMKEEDSANADDNFLKFLLEEGDEGFFALTMRQSKNMEGLPPTVWAEDQRDKFEELIIDYPDLGGLIIGVEGGGAAKFSSVIYNRQLSEETFPGSGVMRRERLSLDDMLTDTRVRAGWEEYGNLMDWVYGKMRESGLPNLRVSEAAVLKATRDTVLANIAEEFPLWHDEFSNPDTTKWADRIEGMRRIVEIYEDPNDTRFDGREDIEQLKRYLEMRGSVERALAARKAAGGSGQLDASSNQDIATAWDTWRLGWADNPAAGDLFFRWFEFDSIKQDTWAE